MGKFERLLLAAALLASSFVSLQIGLQLEDLLLPLMNPVPFPCFRQAKQQCRRAFRKRGLQKTF